MKYYENIKEWIVNIACKFVKPVPGLMTIATTNDPSKY